MKIAKITSLAAVGLTAAGVAVRLLGAAGPLPWVLTVAGILFGAVALVIAGRATSRPRSGSWIRRDGTVVPIVFRPDPVIPNRFIALCAGDETLPEFEEGDQFTVDAIGSGQSVVFCGKPIGGGT